MCGSKKVKMSNTSVATPVQPVATPTYADASVTKASDIQRQKIAGLGGRNIKTSARGIEQEAITNKRKLLGE